MNQFISGRLDVAPTAHAHRSNRTFSWLGPGWLTVLLVLVVATFFAPRAQAEVTTVSPCVLESSMVELSCYATAEDVARTYTTRIRGGLMGYEITGVRCPAWGAWGDRELYKTCYVDYRWLYKNPEPNPPTVVSETWQVGAWTCREPFRFMPKVGCVGVDDRYHSDQCTPSVGNPIQLLSGTKREVVVLDDALQLTLTYSSERNLLAESHTTAFTYQAPKSFGKLWEASSHRQILHRKGVNDVMLARGGGNWRQFSILNGLYVDRGSSSNRLVWVGGWRYFDLGTNTLEVYNDQGHLLSVSPAGGGRQDNVYSDASTPPTIAPHSGLLIEVRDHHGRVGRFTYSQPVDSTLPVRIDTFTNFAGLKSSFFYDPQGNLARIAWPNGDERSFVYERSDLPWALTGVRNEAGTRSATFTYDDIGRAIATEGAGAINRYSVAHTSAPTWYVTETYDSSGRKIWRDHWLRPPQGTTVTRPDGTVVAMGSLDVRGSPRLTSQSQPAGSGCGPASSSQEYDANANVTRRDDFTGLRTCHAHDQSRNLETSRVEGLSNTQACSAVTPVNAALPSGSRKTSTAWHPDWRLATKIAEPRRLTTNVYNGQPDPFAGNAIASCAPATAKLPDGKPIAVLCKTVEQATFDAAGAAGFAAALDTSVPSRVWTHTYNEFGQVLTSRDPRNNTTTNAYYPSSTADYTRGDLEKTTNALTQSTRFTKYNPMGQVLQSIDANNVVTDYEYDLRQRLRRQTTAGQSTIYAYFPTGLLQRATQPDSSYVEYEYDPAQRLVAVQDNLGNRIEYSLDNSGRQREERVKDPTGVLKRQVSRVFDALGRTQQVTGRE